MVSILLILLVAGLPYEAIELRGVDSGFSFGVPTYSGEGCPHGTFSFVHSPDDQSLSVLFDEFQAEAGPLKPFEFKECTAIIPVSLGDPVQMALVQADFRGFCLLPTCGRAEFSAALSFESNQSFHSIHRLSFRGPKNEDFIESSQHALVSQCGGSEALVIHMKAFVKTNKRQEQALLQLDSKDLTLVSAGLSPRTARHEHKYHLRIHPCSH